MRKWKVCLRADSHAWDDFQQDLREQAHAELKSLAEVDKDGHDYQRGKIAGIQSVISRATAEEREERSKHEYGRRNRDA